ncbi:MAG: hypothetical protein ACRCWF_07430 [Beijerinckiaceae bacterium]
MNGEPKPEGAFDRLRQTVRRKGPLSFTDLSATIVDAQKETGFVDTLSVDGADIADGQIAEGGYGGTALDHEDGAELPKPDNTRGSDDGKPPAKTEVALSPATTIPAGTSTSIPMRKGRVRAAVVQCNLKISEELRDALHLQALRERRTIADLVTEIMSGYLTAQGTFERLRR